MKSRDRLRWAIFLSCWVLFASACGGGSPTTSQADSADSTVGHDLLGEIDLGIEDVGLDLGTPDLGSDLSKPDLGVDLSVGDLSDVDLFVGDLIQSDAGTTDLQLDAGLVSDLAQLDISLGDLFGQFDGQSDTDPVDVGGVDVDTDGGISVDGADANLPTPTTIYALQDPAQALPNDQPCSEVSLENPVVVRSEPVTITNVVVTGPLHSADTLFQFYVAEKAGGKYSGIAVVMDKDDYFSKVPVGPNGRPIKVGDELTITGKLQEFFCFTRILIEFDNPAHKLLKTATDQPLPNPVKIRSCAELEDEALEGVLVEFSSLTVEDNTLNFGEIEVKDTEGETCLLDDEFRTNLDHPFWSDNPLVETYKDRPGVTYSTYRSVVGLLQYAFQKYKLQPRGLHDLTPFGSCDDKIKNAGESDVDCGDRTVWINELMNWTETGLPGVTVLRFFVEFAGPAGKDLTGWKLVFYAVETQMEIATLPLTKTLSSEAADKGLGFFREVHTVGETLGVPPGWDKRAIALSTVGWKSARLPDTRRSVRTATFRS